MSVTLNWIVTVISHNCPGLFIVVGRGKVMLLHTPVSNRTAKRERASFSMHPEISELPFSETTARGESVMARPRLFIPYQQNSRTPLAISRFPHGQTFRRISPPCANHD
jgi:hypothetical protein